MGHIIHRVLRIHVDYCVCWCCAVELNVSSATLVVYAPMTASNVGVLYRMTTVTRLYSDTQTRAWTSNILLHHAILASYFMSLCTFAVCVRSIEVSMCTSIT